MQKIIFVIALFATVVASVRAASIGQRQKVCEGDTVVADVENPLEGMEVTIHWHGTSDSEVPFIVRFPIQQGIDFSAQQVNRKAGTHFWHSDTGLQKMDGVFGSIVIRQAPSEGFPGRLAVNTDQDPESTLIKLNLTQGLVNNTDLLNGGVIQLQLNLTEGLTGNSIQFQRANPILANVTGNPLTEVLNISGVNSTLPGVP